MYKKKLINLVLMSLLPMSGALAAEETTEPQAASESSAAVAEAPETEAVEKAQGAEKQATAAEGGESQAQKQQPDYGRMSMEERWKAREQRYEELKKRAEEAGVMLPEDPPWRDRQSMMDMPPKMQKRMEHMRKMQAMTPEERDAYRMERYQEMRQSAAEIGLELPEIPPWKDRQAMLEDEWRQHMEAIKGMTDEERAACHAMHRRHMRMMRGPMMRGQGMKSPMPAMQQSMPAMQPPMHEGPGPDYGYGPYPYGPRGSYWEPIQ